MIRHTLAAALLLATFGTAMAASQPEQTNSATASQLALEIRSCNQIDDVAKRDACKQGAWNERGYNLRVPLREPGRFERQSN